MSKRKRFWSCNEKLRENLKRLSLQRDVFLERWLRKKKKKIVRSNLGENRDLCWNASWIKTFSPRMWTKFICFSSRICCWWPTRFWFMFFILFCSFVFYRLLGLINAVPWFRWDPTWSVSRTLPTWLLCRFATFICLYLYWLIEGKFAPTECVLFDHSFSHIHLHGLRSGRKGRMDARLEQVHCELFCSLLVSNTKEDWSDDSWIRG